MGVSEFQVETAVVHYVPTAHDDEGTKVLLTDEAIELDDQLKRYFRGKIVKSLASKGLDVITDPEKPQVVPDAVSAMLANPAEIVAASKRIALHLDAEQSGRNSSGLLAVVDGRIGTAGAIGIVKLERERGVRFEIDSVGGRNTVNLELLRNLTMTDKTKVYKTAIFEISDGRLEGLVADDQRRTLAGSQVASFFLADFLGCKPMEDAAKLTFEFVKAANASINEDVASPETKGRYQVALLAAMQDQTADIRPRRFVNNHLDVSDRPAFLQRIRDAGVDPDRTFPKDLTLVKVSGFKMTFRSGMVLVGDMAALEEKVEIPQQQQGARPTPVKLYDVMENLTGK